MDAPDSPSCQILQSMSLARYTIGIIKNVIKGCGVEVLVHQVLVGKPVGWDPAPMVRMMMTKKGSILDEGAANGDFESTVLSVKPTKSLRIGRNDFCPCGSSKKYKKCCSNNAPLSKNEDAA